MENLLRKENLKKGVIVSLVVLVMLSNAIPLIPGDSGFFNV